ncbi:Dipeptidyl-peptidase 5 [Smittium culicis]|uniref:Dipeptidyl-peptidase V n=1 Tax=Smittium culicis TaxID=133412 RepID=A0A1R1YI83_9FUNG|nr:Dipeptidyl-peptidase 5 [Smittium culicis]
MGFALAGAFNPDPGLFPDWSKVDKFEPDTYMQLKRMSSPSLSPDKSKVVYSLYKYNNTDNESGRNLRLLDLNIGFDSAIDLTEYKYKQGDSSPIWINDDTVAFVATRGSPSSNIFTISIKDKKITQLTNYTNGVSGIVYDRTSGMIAFISKVYQGMSMNQSAIERKRISDLPSSGVVHTKLFTRHWDEWVLKDRNQLFTIKLSNDNGSLRVMGEPNNIVSKYKGEWGLEPDSYFFSPDGKSILYSAKIEGMSEAWKTDVGIFESPVDGSAEPFRINSNFDGAASSPVYSTDGNSISWLQMVTPGYESDQNQVIFYDIKTKSQKRLISTWDRSPSSVSFSDDSSKLMLEVPYEKDLAIFELDIATNKITRLTGAGTYSLISQLSSDSFLVSLSTLQFPTSLFTLKITYDCNEVNQVSFEDKNILDKLWLSPTETFWFTGALNDSVQAMVLYPYGFDPNCVYPVFYLIHGGPQSSWNDGWSWRWNPNIYANQGFLVVIVNFHGGDAYGQAFTDSIRHNWGTYPYEDLMTGLDTLINSASFVDKENIVGVGASYGGYMVNWINGHTDRFKALVNHDGGFSVVSKYYASDELYFNEREFGIPWIPSDREIYERNNPERYVSNWKTPTLIIHSEYDYRVPISESLSTFTALQRLGIDSKFLYFPDESHWITNPPNVLKWISEILDWTGSYTNTTVWHLAE